MLGSLVEGRQGLRVVRHGEVVELVLVALGRGGRRRLVVVVVAGGGLEGRREVGRLELGAVVRVHAATRAARAAAAPGAAPAVVMVVVVVVAGAAERRRPAPAAAAAPRTAPAERDDAAVPAQPVLKHNTTHLTNHRHKVEILFHLANIDF